MNIQTKIDVHNSVDTFASFVHSNAEFFAIMLDNKKKMLEWYKNAKASDMKSIGEMYDKLIGNAEAELAEINRHVTHLGLRIPTKPSVLDGENANAHK